MTLDTKTGRALRQTRTVSSQSITVRQIRKVACVQLIDGVVPQKNTADIEVEPVAAPSTALVAILLFFGFGIS